MSDAGKSETVEMRPLSPRRDPAGAGNKAMDLEEKRRQLRRQISKNRRLHSRGLSVSRLDSVSSACSTESNEVIDALFFFNPTSVNVI